MTPSLTDTLCTRCGLCCDGSLFADVELASRREATGLEVLGLDIEDDGANTALLLQPCRALVGRRCSVYTHRPACCRSFECRLLQEARSGTIDVERAGEHITDALRRIRRVKTLLAALGQRDDKLPLAERCADALATKSAATPAAKRNRSQLELEWAGVSRLLRRRFLETGRRDG